MIHIPADLASRYGFIMLAGERCKQLMRGAHPRVESQFHKPTSIAQEEVLAGLVRQGEDEADCAEPFSQGGELIPLLGDEGANPEE